MLQMEELCFFLLWLGDTEVQSFLPNAHKDTSRYNETYEFKRKKAYFLYFTGQMRTCTKIHFYCCYVVFFFVFRQVSGKKFKILLKNIYIIGYII